MLKYKLSNGRSILSNSELIIPTLKKYDFEKLGYDSPNLENPLPSISRNSSRNTLNSFDQIMYQKPNDFRLTNKNTKGTNILLYSQYFTTEKKETIIYNYISCLIHLVVIFISYMFCFSHLIDLGYFNKISFLHLYTIDNVFYLISYLNLWFKTNLDKHLVFISFDKRIIYYITLSLPLQLIYLLNDKLYIGFLLIFAMPSVMNWLTDIYKFQKLYRQYLKQLEEFGYFLICKQTAKVLNNISRECIDIDPNFTHKDFNLVIRNFNQNTIINFLCSFFVASILHYFEAGGVKVYTMLFRQYYFNEYFGGVRNNDSEDKIFFNKILTNKDWNKLFDPYTLNKLINYYINTDSQDKNVITKYIDQIVFIFKHLYLQFIACWIILGLNIFNGAGILTNLFFINGNKIKKILSIVLIFIFYVINIYHSDALLLLIICNLTLFCIVNKITFSIIKDIYKLLINGCKC